MAKKTVKDLRDLKGTHVFVRVDYNCPLEDGGITDDTRIRASLPTLEYLVKAGARLALASHLGRPKKGPTPELSLAPVAARLGELLRREVPMASDCVGDDVRKQAEALEDGGVLLLENVRFHPEEEKNDPAFARRLVENTRSTVFVNDAFGSAHRAHASTEGVAHHVKHAVAGFLMEKEIRYLDMAVHPRERPLIAVLGGAKVSDKIQVIEALLERVDALLIGGGMAYTFFRAKGYATGRAWSEDKVPWPRSPEEGRGQDRARGPRGRFEVRGRRRAQGSCPRRSVPRAGWASTSDPSPAAPTPSVSATPRSSSGTAPWASSR